MIGRIRGRKLGYIIFLTCIGFIIVLLISGKVEAQTYNAIWITGLEASPNPMFSGDTTTITVETFEYAQWFWLFPTTMVRPTVIVYIAGRPFIANMTSEQMGQIGFWGSWFYWWFNQVGRWTHQIQWDGRDLQGNLVPPGPYLATINVYAGGASTFGSVVITVEEPRNIVLFLNPLEIWPEQNTEVSVVVLDRNNNNVPNYSVTLQAFAPQYQGDPCDDCGGHSHDTNRPIGDFLSPQGDPIGYTVQGTTGPNGEPFKVMYRASKFGGIENIKAFGTGEPEVKDEKRLTVRILGLESLSGAYFFLKCEIENCVGYRHTNFYNATPGVNSLFSNIASTYYQQFPTDQLLVVTDASLAWGGLYDYKDTWAPPHTYHRIGTDIDVRSKNIPESNRKEFEKIVCKNYGFPDLEYEGQANEHYHLYFFPYDPSIGSFCGEGPI